VTAADLPAETIVGDPFYDLLALSTRTAEDGAVTVTAAGEVDTFTAPLLRSVLDTQLQRHPTELVIDLSGIQFLGSAGLAVLVETHKSARDRDVGFQLIITTGAVARALTVTGLIDLFTVTDAAHR
jgi:anti-sigma B factor antagonist